MLIILIVTASCILALVNGYSNSFGPAAQRKLSLNRIRNGYLDNNRLKYAHFATKVKTIAAADDVPIVFRYTSLMVDLWKAMAFPKESGAETDFVLADYGLNRIQMKGFINHIEGCKDCSMDGAFLMATQLPDGRDAMKLNYVAFQLLSGEEDEEEWGNFDPALLKAEESLDQAVEQLPVFPIEPDDELVLADSKRWVGKVIAEFGVCPFTIDPNRAGIPLGGVRYSVSRAVTPEEAFYRYWKEVQLILTNPEKQLATTLLIFPEIELFGNYELFESYCESLSDALTVSSLGLESQIQLVFFHPRFNFRDGQDRVMTSGEAGGPQSACLNYARRAPWPMINILRTSQVRAAQRGLPTGLVYKQNEERLTEIGAKNLQTMLYHRDWKELPRCPTFTAKKGLEDAYTVDLNNPLLTAVTYPEQPRAETEKCPYIPPTTNDAQDLERELLEHQEEAESVETNESSGEIDYLQLAEDVDKWLAEQDK